MMNKKPMVMAITILAIVSMAFPLASSGFTNYIFQEDFNGTTLDNTTWVNQSTPFPYEMKDDGRIIIHFDPNPLKRYSATDPIKLNVNKIHGEINFAVYTSRYQPNSSYSHAFVGVIFTDNRTADPVPPLAYNKGVWANIGATNSPTIGGIYYYSLRIGNKIVTKSESHNYEGENYGVETDLKFIFDVTIQDNETMFVSEQLYKNGELLVAHADYMNSFDKSMVVFFSAQKVSGLTPVDGYMAIDDIRIGQFTPDENTTTEKTTVYEYFMTITMIMLMISGIALFFYDKAPIIDIVGVVSFYMSFALMSLFFLTYPYTIFSLPAWIFALLPLLPIVIGIVKTEKLSLFQ